MKRILLLLCFAVLGISSGFAQGGGSIAPAEVTENTSSITLKTIRALFPDQPVAVANELFGGLHSVATVSEIHGLTGTLDDAELQIGMLVYVESLNMYYRYKGKGTTANINGADAPLDDNLVSEEHWESLALNIYEQIDSLVGVQISDSLELVYDSVGTMISDSLVLVYDSVETMIGDSMVLVYDSVETMISDSLVLVYDSVETMIGDSMILVYDSVETMISDSLVLVYDSVETMIGDSMILVYDSVETMIGDSLVLVYDSVETMISDSLVLVYDSVETMIGDSLVLVYDSVETMISDSLVLVYDSVETMIGDSLVLVYDSVETMISDSLILVYDSVNTLISDSIAANADSVFSGTEAERLLLTDHTEGDIFIQGDTTYVINNDVWEVLAIQTSNTISYNADTAVAGAVTGDLAINGDTTFVWDGDANSWEIISIIDTVSAPTYKVYYDDGTGIAAWPGEFTDQDEFRSNGVKTIQGTINAGIVLYYPAAWGDFTYSIGYPLLTPTMKVELTNGINSIQGAEPLAGTSTVQYKQVTVSCRAALLYVE